MVAAVEDGELQFPAFPFKPYDIQLQFMRAVYRALQKGGVAIVESPTGALHSPLPPFFFFPYVSSSDLVHGDMTDCMF